MLAYQFKSEKKYSKAALLLEIVAEQIRKTDSMIFASDMEDAAKMWMLAEKIDKAMIDAIKALKQLNDSGDLKFMPSSAEKLVSFVEDMQVAGYTVEAETFFNEINQCLAVIGQPPVDRPKPITRWRFPSICPNCGGNLKWSENVSQVKCGFCQSFVQGEEIKEDHSIAQTNNAAQ